MWQTFEPSCAADILLAANRRLHALRALAHRRRWIASGRRYRPEAAAQQAARDSEGVTTKANLILDAAGNKLSGADLSIAAFNTGIAGSGVVVTLGLVVFAFTTILGWSFYGERCTTYLFGDSAVLPFRLTWVAVVVIGAVAGDRGVIWSIADTLNGLMALPNLVALILLSGTVFKLTKAYSFSE